MPMPHHNRILRLLSAIDTTIGLQLNAVLHHSRFQALEAAWRGLALLIFKLPSSQHIRIRILDLKQVQLSKDLQQAIEFDQSQLFRKIYHQEYGQAGGQPYGILIGNYRFSHSRSDCDTLRAIMKISAASFAPFIASIAPRFFGVDTYSELRPTLTFSNLLKHDDYRQWQKLRQEEDARFVGLVLPRILLRHPYNQYGIKHKHRFFIESAGKINHYLWGNAAFAYAFVVLKTFIQSGWLADIRGINATVSTGGNLSTLSRNYFSTDKPGIAPKIATDIYLTDNQEKCFSEMGLLALQDNPGMNTAIFYSSQSIQTAKRYSNKSANNNARISTMLHYMFCISRFAHYIKVMIRDKVGCFISAEECENMMQGWLLSYCAASQNISAVMKARHPLHEARIKIFEQPGNPGIYTCTLHLKPHYQLDEIQSQLHLVTDINIK